MSPILPNFRTDLPADQPKHPFLLRVEQRRAEMVARVAAQAAEAKAEAAAPTEPAGRSKARGVAGGRLPQGIYRGTTPGTFRADAGRDPTTGKRRRKDGFATVDEAMTWRERSLAADSGADLAVIDFTAKLPLAFGRALWDVKTRLAAKQAEAERKTVKPTQSGALPVPAADASGPAGEAVAAAKPDLPLAQFEFTPELLVEMTGEFSADIIARILGRLVAYLKINYLKLTQEVNLNFTVGKFEVSILLSETRTLKQLT